MSKKQFASILKQWRGERLQPEVAAILGVPVITYQSWEQGIRTPKPLTQAGILAILNKLETK